MRVSALKPEDNASVVAEITLIIIAAAKPVPKPRQHIVDLGSPDSDRFCQRYVQTSADHETPGVIAGTQARGAAGLAGLPQIAVSIGMGAPEKRFDKRFPVLVAEFENGSHVVGK